MDYKTGKLYLIIIIYYILIIINKENIFFLHIKNVKVKIIGFKSNTESKI